MTAPITTPSDPGFFALLARLHGHRCPMSILGARLGWAALAALGERSAPGRLAATYYHQTCALDGIQLATGCTPGNGNLTVLPEGEHRLVLRSDRGERVTARLTPRALDLGGAYGALGAEAAALPPQSPDRAALTARREALLRDLEGAPEGALVDLRAEP